MKEISTSIHVSHLYFSYNQETPLLTDVTFELFKGEFIGIIGPNGGGKTTLLKLLLGFLQPLSGEITLFGDSPKKYPHIAYVPQHLPFDRLFPISVMDVILAGRLAHLPWHGMHSAEDLQIAQKSLEQVGLEKLAKSSFGSLSGGEAQRVLIARALASQPTLLLLDEPTSSVDVEAQTKIYEILDTLRSAMTIVMVTHDLPAVIERVERVICVQGTALSLQPHEVCDHFKLGLYHAPLIQVEGRC